MALVNGIDFSFGLYRRLGQLSSKNIFLGICSLIRELGAPFFASQSMREAG
jgi:hypothetical protein